MSARAEQLGGGERAAELRGWSTVALRASLEAYQGRQALSAVEMAFATAIVVELNWRASVERERWNAMAQR